VDTTSRRGPLVSILIPCYNAERFVADAVNSALNQTHDNIEVVVIDDGSRDSSREVLKSFGDRIIFEAGPNQGACAARNRAFELCSGEYIQYLDSDDKLAVNKIDSQLPALETGDSDISLCKIGLFGDEKGERQEKRQHPHPVGDALEYFLNHPIQTAAPLMHRTWVEKSGGFRKGLKRGQEADFHRRLGALGPRLSMVDQILVWVRMHDGPRITHKAVDPHQTVEVWLSLVEAIAASAAWNEDRRYTIAKSLLDASRSLYAQGGEALAIEGIETAVEICPRVLDCDRLSRRVLTAIFGPIKAERFIRAVR